MIDPVGAFVPGAHVHLQGSSSGPLTGLSFAVKDIIDIAGFVTGCGNPDWQATHAPATAHAPCVDALLAAGATLVAKAITEEFATGLMGENAFYGSPKNVAAPGRFAGGSSSGSASAVAAGLVDFALGSDTGGSVRAPASFCGLWGLRPTHGRVPLMGVMPLSPSLDTVGWLARDARTLMHVGRVLLGEDGAPRADRLIVACDSMQRIAPEHRTALQPAIERIAATTGLRVEEIDIAASPSLPGLDTWAAVQRTLWGYEAWQALGPWMKDGKPRLGPATAERFADRAKVTRQDYEAALAQRATLRAHIRGVMCDNAVLLLPAAPGIAPSLTDDAETKDLIRQANERLSCVSGLAGLPQLSAPLSSWQGCPLGIGLAAAPGNDLLLLALARALDGDPASPA